MFYFRTRVRRVFKSQCSHNYESLITKFRLLRLLVCVLLSKRNKMYFVMFAQVKFIQLIY